MKNLIELYRDTILFTGGLTLSNIDVIIADEGYIQKVDFTQVKEDKQDNGYYVGLAGSSFDIIEDYLLIPTIDAILTDFIKRPNSNISDPAIVRYNRLSEDNCLFLPSRLGFWLDRENEKDILYVDLVAHIKDKTVALEIASYCEQIAIYDCANQCSIDV